MEAMITLNCEKYSDNIIDVLKLFQDIGWDIYDTQGMVEFLPINDSGQYNWKREKISELTLYNIISDKIMHGEQIGINLFYNNGCEGITFIAESTKQIVLCLSINRKIYCGRYTDMAWYFENIVYKLLNKNVRLLSYEVEEFED